MAKKTKEQQLIEQAVAAALAGKQGTTVSDSNFYGVHFDARACETIETIGQALVKNAEACAENAKALGALSAVLKTSNVNIECLLKLETVKS